MYVRIIVHNNRTQYNNNSSDYFPLNPQTIIKAQMLSIGGEGKTRH